MAGMYCELNLAITNDCLATINTCAPGDITCLTTAACMSTEKNCVSDITNASITSVVKGPTSKPKRFLQKPIL